MMFVTDYLFEEVERMFDEKAQQEIWDFANKFDIYEVEDKVHQLVFNNGKNVLIATSEGNTIVDYKIENKEVK